MARKVTPTSLRVGITKSWKSKWFLKPTKNYRSFLIQDIKIRDFIFEKLRHAAIEKVEIGRTPQSITLDIFTSRPGIIIGRGGGGVEELKKQIQKMLPPKTKININIQEVKNPEASAKLVTFFMTEQIEKRIPYRRVIKQAIAKAMGAPGVLGIKVMVSGRLDGAEIARTEWLARGRLPLQTLRAEIDFAKEKAYTTYGVIGIKVWIYKGEVFEKKKSG